MRRPVVFVAWSVATAGACVLAWTAVDHVAARVTDHTPVVGESSIRAALRATSRDGTPSNGGAGSDTPGAGAASPDAANPGSGGANATNARGAANTGAGVGTPTGSGRGTQNTGAGSGTATPAPRLTPSTTTTTSPHAPPTLPPPPPTTNAASVIVIGGSVTASCGAGSPNLVSAIPSNGFGTSVSRGFQLVVDFTSATHRSIVEAECEGTHVQWSTGEEAAN